MFSALKKFDVYRSVPKDLTEQTLSGAVVSLCCALLVAFLFLSELGSFLRTDTHSEMFVDKDTEHHTHAEISIRMNITVPAIACPMTSVDVQDVMGSHIVGYGGKLHRWRTDETGQLKFLNGQPMAHDSARPEDQRGEGCNVQGTLIVKRVPGNFHVSGHAHGDLLQVFYPSFPRETLNCTHIIHDLQFGETDELRKLEEAAVAPLNGARKTAFVRQDNQAISYEYYLRVVPSLLDKLNGDSIESFQFVSNSNELVGRSAMPAIYFKFDFSPITVRFYESKSSFAHFLVQVCAIVGGVFTVLGLVNGVLLAASKKFKHGINKLG